MAILLCSNLLSGNTGLDKSVVMTANGLHRAGYDVTVLNFVGPGDGTRFLMPRWPIDPGIGVFPLQTLPADGGRFLHQAFHRATWGRIPNLNYSFTRNALRALRQLNGALGADDVIIFTHPVQAIAYRDAIGDEARRVRTVIQIHGDYKTRHPELWPMLLDARSVVDYIQIISTGMRADYVKEFGEDRVVLVPNIHEPVEVDREAHQTINVALIGSFQEAKNQVDAVRALTLIRDKRVHLVLWGNNTTPYGNHVRALAEAAGVASRVHLPGTGSEADIYGSADIVISPSHSEGLSYILLESASHGLPVVAYDYQHGPRDVISDGETGFIVPLGDVAALARRIEQLAADPELRRSMGQGARDVYERSFSPKAVVESYRELLGEVSDKRVDLPSVFPIEGQMPVAHENIRVRTVAVRGRRIGHLIDIRSDTPLRNFRIDVGRRSTAAPVVRLGNRYLVALSRSGWGRHPRRVEAQVLSCETDRAEDGRFYIGNTTRRARFEVIPFLRRDAVYPDLGEAGIEVHGTSMVVPRHPRYPVTSGVDNFGSAVNVTGGVQVATTGSVVAPTVAVRGEFDAVELFDALGPRTFTAPYSYRELFERVCEAETSGGLDDLVHDGVHPWELFRAAFLAQTAEALGMWGQHFTPKPLPLWDVYNGPKRLAGAQGFSKVLFEFPRRPEGKDFRTAAFHDDDTMIIEYPQPAGYSLALAASSNRFPISEFNAWRKERGSTVRPVDPAPYEAVLSEALGFRVSLGNRLTGRVQKFVDERDFWSPVFQAVRPDEVIIPSSYWSAGISAAATEAGAEVADVQYALTSRYHPSFWFGNRPRYGATKLYAWSDFWLPRTNAYTESTIVPRLVPGLTLPSAEMSESETSWDVCVVSQPRIFRRVMRFVSEFASTFPDARICIAPHPDERSTTEAKLAALNLNDRVDIAPFSTLRAIRSSAMCVGAYSTSLYEAAALGKPTYVLPVPGHEIVAEDVAAGLFRMVEDVADVVPYDTAGPRSDIFGGLA